MRIEIVNGFIDQETIQSLNEFVSQNIHRFQDGQNSSHINKPGQHLVSRFSEINYPMFVYDIYDRLNGLLSLPAEARCRISPIVVNRTMNGGALISHKDISHESGKALLRCNFVTSSPDGGGVLYVDGKPIHLVTGDLYLCLVSEHYHWTTPVVGGSPRTVWQFGYSVSKEDWDSGAITLKDKCK